MSVSGLCQICRDTEGSRTCERCGNFVCEDHWDSAEHACMECAELAEDPEEPSGFKLD